MTVQADTLTLLKILFCDNCANKEKWPLAHKEEGKGYFITFGGYYGCHNFEGKNNG